MPIPNAPPLTSEEVAALNDRLAREHPINAYYDDSPWVVRWIEGRRLDIIRDMVNARPGLRILEVGSGGGHVLRMFRDAKLTAVDVSEVFLDTARKNLAGYEVEFFKGEIEKLVLPEKSFDRIICTEVLEHTTDPRPVLAEICRLLRPDGHAVITVPVDPLIDGLKKVVRYSPVGWALGNRINWGGDHYHFHKWWPWQFVRLLERDFTVVEKRASPFDALPLRVCFKCRPARR
ncbi:MAG: class I SAM-dependent methyltransferase [Polyangiaceae bacterium]|nr:class I SAM-dependent methyltransferase [Polyangiaceae bacterium]